MAEITGIQWTDHTFNPWRGCEKISPACKNCYAEKTAKRNPAVLGEWGLGTARVMAAESYWRKPLKWNRDAEAAGERRRVFCASLADVFEDRSDLDMARHRLFELIVATPHLDWQILTKRPELMAAWAAEFGWPSNAWAGCTVEDQRRAEERLPWLARVPAGVRFVSYEPALGPVDWSAFVTRHQAPEVKPFHWLIVGGESGSDARPFDVSWAQMAVVDGWAAGFSVFVKQLGAQPIGLGERAITHPKGGDIEEWPRSLRMREFPSSPRVR